MILQNIQLAMAVTASGCGGGAGAPSRRTAFHRLSSAARRRHAKTPRLCAGLPWAAITGLPLPDQHLCDAPKSQSKFGTSPGGCGSCRGPSLMLCCCSVVPGIMVTVYACCLDNKVENLSAGSLQTAHIAHPSRSISATLSRGHLWSWRLRQVWMDEWLVKTRPCNGSLRPEELDAGNKGEQRGTKLSKKHWIVWFEELQEIHASHESYAYWMHLHLNKFFYCTGHLGRSTSRCPWTSCWFSSHPCWSEPGCVWHFAAEDKEPLLDTIDFAGSENHQESKSIL